MNSRTQKILRGIEIILSVQPETDFCAEHDIIYFGSYTPEDFTPEQLKELDELGWREEVDSWSHYV